MPPKRAAPASAAATGSKAKKSKTKGSDEVPVQPRNKRWAAVSGSANADLEYRDFDMEFDDEDEEESDNGAHEPAQPSAKCDGGKTYFCLKAASKYPEHGWKLSDTGFRKYLTQTIHSDLRCPDNFDMYTFNDHHGYGTLEVVQNLFLDFVEAEDNWNEQWATCEETAMFLLMGDGYAQMAMIDDANAVYETNRLIGRMFLTMLACLDCKNLLASDSEILSLATVMSLYIRLHSDIEFDDEDDKEGNAKFKFSVNNFNDYVAAYAKKHNINLSGIGDIDELLQSCDENTNLPATADAKNDPMELEESI